VEFDVPVHATYLDPATIPTPAPTFAEAASAMRGRYLATEAGVCIECHTQHNPPAMPPNPIVLDPAKYFSGGEMFPLGFPVVPVSKNLTSDAVTGLANWSPTDIVNALKQGKDRDGKGICPPMPVGPMGAFGGLSNEDALDIANYIKSLPPIANRIDDMCSFPFPAPPDGAAGSDASSDAGTDAQD
jgi:cytochrome c553